MLLLATGLIIHKPQFFGMFSFSYVVTVHNVLGFILLANAALDMGVSVTVVLQSTAVFCAVRGFYDHVSASSPIKHLVDRFTNAGGVLIACCTSLEERKIDKNMLLESVEVVRAGRVITEVMEAVSVLNY